VGFIVIFRTFSTLRVFSAPKQNYEEPATVRMGQVSQDDFMMLKSDWNLKLKWHDRDEPGSAAR
jgi:hypothetical protein